MKGWTVKHKETGKLHTIKDVVDTGIPAHLPNGGNVYHLDGLDKPVHQSMISEPEPPKMKKREDKIPGGLADKKSAKDFDPKSLKAGMKVESEHTSDKGIAQEIAMDHLTEDPKYYKKLKEVEKKDMVETTADGKKEIVEGKEPLKKDPKARWDSLKKALNHAESIMDIEEEMEPEQDEQPEADASAQDGDSGGSAPADGLQGDVGGGEPEGQPVDAAPQESLDSQEAVDGKEEGLNPEDAEAKIVQALKDEGYSEAEISYIVHGHHSPELSETDAAKAKATSDMSSIDTAHAQRQADLEHEHTKRMNDLEHKKAENEMADPETERNHRKRMLDLEYETTEKKKAEAEAALAHKQRMMDLEYGKANKEASQEDPTMAMKAEQLKFELEMKRKEKELELEYKEKELKLKLKLQEEAAKQKAEHAAAQAEEDAKVNAAVKKEQAKHKIAEAKKPPVKEN